MKNEINEIENALIELQKDVKHSQDISQLKEQLAYQNGKIEALSSVLKVEYVGIYKE
jgi:TolA-binding protein